MFVDIMSYIKCHHNMWNRNETNEKGTRTYHNNGLEFIKTETNLYNNFPEIALFSYSRVCRSAISE